MATHADLEAMSQDEDPSHGNGIRLTNLQESTTYIVHHVSQDQIEQMEHIQVHPDEAEDEDQSDLMDEFLHIKEENEIEKVVHARRGRKRKIDSESWMRMKGKESFQNKYAKRFTESWLEHVDFKDWLERHPGSDRKAICKVCNKVLLVGKSELLKHGRSKKHRKFMNISMGWNEGSYEDQSDENMKQEKFTEDISISVHDDVMSLDMFKDWVIPHPDEPSNSHKCMCKACNQVLLATKTELTRHRATKKHKDNMENAGLKDCVSDGDGDDNFDSTVVSQYTGEEDVDENLDNQQIFEEYADINPRIIKLNAVPVTSSIPSQKKINDKSKEYVEEPVKQAFVTSPAPYFRGKGVVNGHISELKLSDYKGRYLVLFFYPQDFATVCSTEILALGDVISAFRVINCEVVACSVDSHLAHLAWVKTLGSRSDARIVPLLSDASHTISKAYGCYLPSAGHTLRAYYIIDKKGILRAMNITDIHVGRNLKEILRTVEAFQLSDSTDTQCPVNWTTGQPSIKVVI